MVQTIERRSDSKLDPSKPLIVFSADAHMGPEFGDMRQYCPEALLDEFDDQANAQFALLEAMRSGEGFGFTAMNPGAPEGQRLVRAMERNAKTAGHHDIHAYLHDMDADGVAVEVFFHGSQNGEGVPFLGQLALSPDHTSGDLAKRGLGMHMYNQWLADAVSVAPNRLMPAMLLPMWSVEESVKELEWGLAHGLRVVSFQAPRAGVPRYDTPAWEPFWSLAEESGTVLSTHSGATDAADFAGATGPHFFSLIELEAGGWMARRAIAWLIFGGIFAKHPGLTFCVTEQNGEWWSATSREYDSSWTNHRFMYADQVPDPPSHYLKQNVFIGASFMAPFEAKWAVEQDYWENVMWGRDYPHIEGTYAYQDDADALSEANCTHLSMRNCFAGIDPEPVAAMLGGNAVRAFGLDEAELQKVADRIHAPTLDELAKPVEGDPDGGILAYRTMGPWW